MSAQTNPKLQRFVKTFLDIIFGLLVFVSIALVILIVLSPVMMKGVNIPLTASVLVGIGSIEEQRFDVQIANAGPKGINNAFVDQAQGNLRLETFNWNYIFLSYFGKLLISLGLTYSFYLLRAVLIDIIRGDPFSSENIFRIRQIGYMVLLLGFLRPAVEYIAANQVIKGLQTSPPLTLPAPFNAEFILFSLLILLLAQVWSYGFELQRDQELTV